MNGKSDKRRARVRSVDIVTRLRQEILSRRWRAGQRLPTRTELERRFTTTSQTIQNAMNVLTAQGFIHARGRRGTFVADQPPHLNHYALVFQTDPVTFKNFGLAWSKYFRALVSAALHLERAQGCRLRPFYGIDQHVDTEDYRRLCDQLAAHQLAGLIFANTPFMDLVGSPILEQPGVPRVALMSPQPDPRVQAVAFDSIGWLDRALQYLVARGRKRVAFVMSGGAFDFLPAALARHGVACPPHWQQSPIYSHASCVANCVALLVHGAKSARPNALVVTDDNLVEPAVAGLIAAGLRVPHDIEVVAHCNFPCPPNAMVPIKRLGYDMGHTLRTCMDLINRQRRGEAVPAARQIPAVFEDELLAQETLTPPAAPQLAELKG